jgi:mRNA interferase RelE/StbE
MSGRNWALKIEWHTAAIKDLKAIDRAMQLRIHKALQELSRLDDPRQKLVAYSGTLANFWKLRVGDYRLVCQILRQNDETILIVRLAHRRDVYSPPSLTKIKNRVE